MMSSRRDYLSAYEPGDIISVVYLVLIAFSGYLIPIVRGVDDSNHAHGLLQVGVGVYIAIAAVSIARKIPPALNLVFASIKTIIALIFLALEIRRLVSLRIILATIILYVSKINIA
ncbi:hypothetical protein GGS21DRAFT_359830 [Xylaria nigripes]|nr:hypothetical protein GGS21DRAFT_359830 [Xylaria nigripes]